MDPPGSGRGDSCWERPGTRGGDVEVPTVDGQEPGRGGPSGGLGGAPGTREKGPAGTDGMGGPWREKLPTEKAVGMLGNVIQYFTGS